MTTKKQKTGGRKKGTPNKTTTAVKAALLDVYDRLGGNKKLQEWAEENLTEFYRLWAKLLPTEIKGLDGTQAAWAEALREAIREGARRDSERPAGGGETLPLPGGAGGDGHAPGVADAPAPRQD